MHGGRLAIGTETTSPNSQPSDFRNADDFELVTVGLGHRAGDNATVDIEVLLRDGD